MNDEIKMRLWCDVYLSTLRRENTKAAGYDSPQAVARNAIIDFEGFFDSPPVDGPWCPAKKETRDDSE